MSMGKILGNHKYRIDCPIAKGAFSTVYRCVDLVTGKVYAVKVVSRAVVEANNMQCAVVREINAMELAPRSKYLVRLVDTLESARNYYFVMNLVEGGTLLDYIRRTPFSASSLLPRRFFRQLLNGLGALHRRNVVHLDIKPENLLLNKEHTRLIISDFGFACYATPGRLLCNARGTLKYCAPELLQPEPAYDGRKVDVWAAGVTLYVMLFNTHPFRGDGDDSDTLVRSILAGKYSFPRPVSPVLEHLFSVLLHPTPEKRWSVQKLLRHAWVLGVDGAGSNAFSCFATVADSSAVNCDTREPSPEAYLVKSAFAATLEDDDDDLHLSTRHSRSCPAIFKDSTFHDTLSTRHDECDMELDCFSDTRSYSRNGYSNNSIYEDDSSDTALVFERRGDYFLSTNTGFSADDNTSCSVSADLASIGVSSSESGGTPVGLTGVASQTRQKRHSVSRSRDFMATLKVIVNFILFCLMFIFISGLRLLFGVDFNNLPIPSFLRVMLGRLFAPPDDDPLERMGPRHRRDETYGETLRRIVALAERVINALDWRRRRVPTRAATDGTEPRQPSARFSPLQERRRR